MSLRRISRNIRGTLDRAIPLRRTHYSLLHYCACWDGLIWEYHLYTLESILLQSYIIIFTAADTFFLKKRKENDGKIRYTAADGETKKEIRCVNFFSKICFAIILSAAIILRSFSRVYPKYRGNMNFWNNQKHPTELWKTMKNPGNGQMLLIKTSFLVINPCGENSITLENQQLDVFIPDFHVERYCAKNSFILIQFSQNGLTHI